MVEYVEFSQELGISGAVVNRPMTPITPIGEGIYSK